MTAPADMSPRCRQFLDDLETLCARYRLHITPAGADMLQVWDRRSDDPGGFDWDAIDDCTDLEVHE